jgi:glycerol-3-phosphate dehydrogenase
LPGGDFAPGEADAFVLQLLSDFPFLDRCHASRLIRAYGRTAWSVLGRVQAMGDLGVDFGASLTEVEVRHLIDREWAQTAEDVLWRRSKLGLHMTPSEMKSLESWMRTAAASPAT